MAEKGLNIYQKLNQIRKSIDGFTKDTKGYNYMYVSGSQALAKIKDCMDELGVILEPHLFHDKGGYQIFEYNEEKFGKIKHVIEYIVQMPMEYHWVNAENPTDRAICPWSLFGQQDEISKAFGSGLTYGERYFILKYFNIPTDELDPDSKKPVEDNTNNNQTPTTNKTNANKNNNKTNNNINTPETPKKDEDPTIKLKNAILAIEKLASELQEKKVNKDLISEAIKKYNIINDKPIANYNKIKDIEIATNVYKELMKLKKVEVK